MNIIVKKTIKKLIQDVQERLIFQAERHIQNEIEYFNPSDEILDYPQILEQDKEAVYPIVGRTLQCLSLLYLSIPVLFFSTNNYRMIHLMILLNGQ